MVKYFGFQGTPYMSIGGLYSIFMVAEYLSYHNENQSLL